MITDTAPALQGERMRAETAEIPEVVARLLSAQPDYWEALARHIAALDPPGVMTIARGSSDNAAQYGGHLLMARLGLPVLSLPPSVPTLYQARLKVQRWLSLSVSQSGQSPDLIDATLASAALGACTLAMVNRASSPLGDAAQWALDLQAGAETSVAATKSCVAQMVCSARLVGQLLQATGRSDAHRFRSGLEALPKALGEAQEQDWSAGLDQLKDCDRLFVIGRGPGFAVAQEAALKLKECCGIQAEAFSSAEVRHGPMALAEPGFQMLVFAPPGLAQAELLGLAAQMRARGVRVALVAPADVPGAQLPMARLDSAQNGLDPSVVNDLSPLLALPSHYRMVEALARARGRNPDAPPHLSKVTLTH
jgi:glucosamine--fructose-6-phosphate aminotransferase (isomerizing)